MVQIYSVKEFLSPFSSFFSLEEEKSEEKRNFYLHVEIILATFCEKSRRNGFELEKTPFVLVNLFYYYNIYIEKKQQESPFSLGD